MKPELVITSILAVMKRIVSNMFRHLKDNNILYTSPHGFRSKSTEAQLVTFVDEFTSEVSCGGQVDAIVLDFSEAFDNVCYKRLLYKLS